MARNEENREMKTYICHLCPRRVCVCAIDEEETPPSHCTKTAKTNADWHPVKGEEEEDTHDK